MSENAESGILGYDPVGGGGINNQKMALFGLMLAAFETGRPVALPRFRVMDQRSRQFEARTFDEVFEPEPMLAFCAAYGITVTACDPDSLPQGYDRFFWKAHHAFHIMPHDWPGPLPKFVGLFFRSLRPLVRNSFLLRALTEQLRRSAPVLTVAQFRIETDWQRHCEDTLSRTVPPEEQNYLPFEDILAKIRNAEGGLPASLFILCDESALPITTAEMKQRARDVFGTELAFKSDFLSGFERRLLTELHLSLLDFEIALAADRFIGISRSTFSSLVTLESFARDGADVTHHFIYNAAGSAILRRTDNGTFWDAAMATRPVTTGA